MLAEGVADGGTDAKHIGRTELDVVLDVIVVDLGPDKYVGQVVPNVIPDTETKVFHEMVAGGVEDASAGGNAAGSRVGKREVSGGNADAGKQIGSKPLGNPRLEERVKVGEEGPVGLAIVGVAEGVVPPGNFRVKTEVVFEADVVGADAEVRAPLQVRRMKAHGVIVRSRGHESAAAEEEVSMLSGREVSEKKNYGRGSEQRKFSQYTLLSVRCGLLECHHGFVAHR